MAVKQGLINHVALVLDASSSMTHLRDKVIRVADEQIAYLARRSKELDQETRVTVYVFANEVECIVYDKDVLRLPSLKDHYKTHGMTALLAATLKSQTELGHAAQLYGDHSFLTFILTDGQENASHRCNAAPSRSPQELRDMVSRRLDQMPDNWTVAVLVPDQIGRREAQQCGFPKDNIALWDATSTSGLEEAGQTIQQATESFMVGRKKGIRGSRSVFSTGADAVNANTIRSAGLTPLDPSSFNLIPVTKEMGIRDWVQKECNLPFKLGSAFYQLSKRENIQPKKHIAVLEKKTGQVYSGQKARDLIGLSNREVRVSPDHNKDYSIFVQSTSVNRKLVPHTQLLLLT